MFWPLLAIVLVWWEALVFKGRPRSRQVLEISNGQVDVQSCHRGRSSVLRLPGMRKPRVSGTSSGRRVALYGGD